MYVLGLENSQSARQKEALLSKHIQARRDKNFNVIKNRSRGASGGRGEMVEGSWEERRE